MGIPNVLWQVALPATSQPGMSEGPNEDVATPTPSSQGRPRPGDEDYTDMLCVLLGTMQRAQRPPLVPDATPAAGAAAGDAWRASITTPLQTPLAPIHLFENMEE
jgi:hypothetical protein